jgi:ATPase subunit of ABC transporter with duplicated ATPase domains
MAYLLGCENIHLEYPAKTIFGSVTLGIDEGDRIGIVGGNGDGKSTLLGVLAGAVEPDGGRVMARGGTVVRVLAQTDSLDPAASVGACVVGDAAEHEWASDARIRAIIAGLIADLPWDAAVGMLSGGQRRRVDLARVLVEDCDVLMLDEPTNHLDVHAIAWLADHLKTRWPKKAGALLVVTHDRWFLDEVCETTWEVHDGQVDRFEGGFSAYVLQRVERAEAARTAEQKRRNVLRKELAWLARGAQARSTKPKFRIKEAQALIANEPPVRNSIELKRAAISRLGKQVVDLEGVTERFGDKTVINDVTWQIGPGDRIGLLGENGSGKTTLLRLVQGQLAPTAGRVKIGSTVKFAYLSQHLEELAESATARVREVLARYKTRYEFDGKELTPAQLLERLGFEQSQLSAVVGDLSGGEKRRLQLMLILLEKPNVLILDEPDNDLDTDMLAVVESLLDSWPGTLLLITHDRYLMERVTDDQYALFGGKVRHVPGGVDEYLRLVDARVAAREKAAAPAAPAAAPAVPASGKPALTYNEERALRKEIAATERALSKAEAKAAKLRDELHAIDPSDYVALMDKQKQVAAAEGEIAEIEETWMRLSEGL